MSLMKKNKFLVFAAFVISMCIICCSCDNQGSLEYTAENTFNVTSFKYNNCTFTLPERITAEKDDNGKITFLLGDTVIGGVTTIPYKNANQFFSDDLINDSPDNDVYRNFVKLVVPDRESDFFFSGFEQGRFSLSVDDEDGSGTTIHYFFPDGDLFYDMFFNQKPVATPEEVTILLNSFTINP